MMGRRIVEEYRELGGRLFQELFDTDFRAGDAMLGLEVE